METNLKATMDTLKVWQRWFWIWTWCWWFALQLVCCRRMKLFHAAQIWKFQLELSSRSWIGLCEVNNLSRYQTKKHTKDKDTTVPTVECSYQSSWFSLSQVLTLVDQSSSRLSIWLQFQDLETIKQTSAPKSWPTSSFKSVPQINLQINYHWVTILISLTKSILEVTRNLRKIYILLLGKGEKVVVQGGGLIWTIVNFFRSKKFGPIFLNRYRKTSLDNMVLPLLQDNST